MAGRVARVLFGTLVAIVWLAACGSTVDSPSGMPPDASSTAVATAAPTPDASAEPLTDEESKATAFRTRVGLRADLEWIREVAARPEAHVGVDVYGNVPLMPFERAELESRPPMDSGVLQRAQSYHYVAPDYAAAFYDEQKRNMLVITFKSNVQAHWEALLAYLPRGTVFEVRQVEWSAVELDAFADLVEAEKAWFPTIGAQFWSASAFEREDVVDVRYLGPQDAGPLIEAHFGNPSWIRAQRDGPLPWTGATGDLVIDVVEADGRPVRDVWFSFDSEHSEVVVNSALPITTNTEGRCVVKRLPAVAYLVRMKVLVDEQFLPLKEFRVELEPGGTHVEVEVEVPDGS
jgi:hypothetical protein